jgi:hypothetical protein
MAGFVCALALAAALAAEPMTLEVDRGAEEVVITFALADDPPESVTAPLASGATTEIDYQLRVYARRRFFPDRKVWKGVARATVTFDAVTGRYLCQLIVNGDTTVSREVGSLAAAHGWLRAPPAVEVPMPDARRGAIIRVRVRAVFASGTAWLVFPTTEGTDWVEMRLDPSAEDPDE